MDGSASRYDGYFHHQISQLGLNISLSSITILAVALRLLARSRSREAVSLDDCLIVVALVIFLMITGFGVWHVIEWGWEENPLSLRVSVLERTLRVRISRKLVDLVMLNACVALLYSIDFGSACDNMHKIEYTMLLQSYLCHKELPTLERYRRCLVLVVGGTSIYHCDPKMQTNQRELGHLTGKPVYRLPTLCCHSRDHQLPTGSCNCLYAYRSHQAPAACSAAEDPAQYRLPAWRFVSLLLTYPAPGTVLTRD